MNKHVVFVCSLPSEKETSPLEECQKPRNQLRKEENITKDVYLTLEEASYSSNFK